MAQLPATVDIMLANTGTPDSLEVRLRANGAPFSELVTEVTFTLAWPSTSTATIGGRTVPCFDALPFAPSPMVTDGDWHYVTHHAIALQLLDEVCPSNTWPADTWVPVMRIKVDGLVGCVPFAIVNDAFTAANNRDFFVSLNGIEAPGVILSGPVDVGNCGGLPDCLGVPGGPALPGTTCDDGDVCTSTDTWGADCVCAGTFVDTDGDGTCDAQDGCPADPLKVEPGICGCGTADTDTDADGTADCNDGCPVDPLKVEPGICGCGTADTDTDADGTADCNDGCPADPLKVEPGICGCGTADTDTDADGIADCMDECPGGQGTIGSSCDDGDPETVNDVLDSACTCHGAPMNDDCADAIAITVQAANDCPANATAGDNTYATAGVTLPSCAPDGVLSDVWYVFNAGDNTDVTITLEHDTTTSMGVAVYTACDGAELHCAAAPSTPFAFAVSPNSAYLVRAFTALSSGQAGPFTICVSAGINTVVPDVTTTVGTLFPNPNDGRFTVRISGAGRTADLRLLDMAGRVVWSAHERVGPDASLDVDATRLVPGVYTLEVDAAGRKSAHRVVLR